MMMEIALMVMAICGLLLVCHWLHGKFSSGMTEEQIVELGRELKKMGYERRDDVDGLAYFERVKPRR